ncbi:MAG: hypothetical protein O6840_02615, partial [Nitrospirae bacterium]|nr:hypothetical protein [Nitrospirota bacterium]
MTPEMVMDVGQMAIETTLLVAGPLLGLSLLVGLALFLTLFIMAPVWEQVQVRALEPYLNEKITQDKALEQAIQPVRAFMMNQVREK